jgi:hypothetical protein
MPAVRAAGRLAKREPGQSAARAIALTSMTAGTSVRAGLYVVTCPVPRTPVDGRPGQRRAGLPGEGGQLIQDWQLAGPRCRVGVQHSPVLPEMRDPAGN